MNNLRRSTNLGAFRFLSALLLVIISAQFCSAKSRKIITFSNNYHGLRLGKSTLKDTTSILGRYLSVQKTSNGYNYRFPKVIVNISGRDKAHINTIVIDKDYSFKTSSGIKLGQAISIAKKHLATYKEGRTWIYDTQKGIFFWHKDKRIVAITLAYQAYR